MGNLISLPPSAPAVDPPPLGLEQQASGGLLCSAPASLVLALGLARGGALVERRAPVAPARLRRSRWTAKHRGEMATIDR